MSNTEINQELNEMRKKLESTHAFAKRLPEFGETILSKKFTGDESHICFGKQYRELWLSWGINRNHYKTDSRCTITNYDYRVGEVYDVHLFCIYINTYSLFDEQEQFGLKEATQDLDLFFFDKLNTNFYATDEQIIPLLNALDEWYIKARSEVDLYRAKKNVVEVEKQLKKAKENLAKLEAKKGNGE